MFLAGKLVKRVSNHFRNHHLGVSEFFQCLKCQRLNLSPNRTALQICWSGRLKFKQAITITIFKVVSVVTRSSHSHNHRPIYQFQRVSFFKVMSRVPFIYEKNNSHSKCRVIIILIFKFNDYYQLLPNFWCLITSCWFIFSLRHLFLIHHHHPFLSTSISTPYYKIVNFVCFIFGFIDLILKFSRRSRRDPHVCVQIFFESFSCQFDSLFSNQLPSTQIAYWLRRNAAILPALFQDVAKHHLFAVSPNQFTKISHFKFTAF